MKSNTLMITGVTGYIGSRLLKKMMMAGWDVVAIVRSDSDQSQVDRLKREITVISYDFHLPTLIKTMQNIQPQVVVHIASHYLATHNSDDIDQLIDGNIRYSTHLMQAVLESGVRKFINTSSFTQHRINQNFQPLSLYASTKQAFESIIEYYSQMGNLQVITLELFDNYGPEDTRPKFLNALIKAYRTGESLNASLGYQRMDLVYIDDVIDAYQKAIELLMEDKIIGHQKFAVSSGHSFSLRDLTNVLERLTGESILVNWGAVPYRDNQIMKPWNKRGGLPGWNSVVSLEEGVRRILNSDTRD